jgi:lipid-A-disaccharide synthase
MPADAAAGPLIFVAAGEPSGDALGARIMQALKEETGGTVRFAGTGGPLMQEQGLKSLIDIREVAYVGLAEVLPHIPRVLQIIRQVAKAAKEAKPDLFVSIDAPGYGLRVAKALKDEPFKRVHCVAPSVWAWKPWRAKQMARYLDHVLTLLPFEPPYFTRHGLAATFFGHPSVEAASLASPDPAGLRKRLGIAPDAPLAILMPGSRRSEITRLVPVLIETMKLLKQRLPDVEAIIPTVPSVSELLKEKLSGWPIPVHVVMGEADRRSAYAAGRIAIAKSGTVGLELAIAGLPAVIIYKVDNISAAIFRRMVRVKWSSVASLVLNRLVQPELLQENCTPEKIMAALEPLLHDSPERRRLIEDGREAALKLGMGEYRPSQRAARLLLSLIPAGQGGRPAP